MFGSRINRALFRGLFGLTYFGSTRRSPVERMIIGAVRINPESRPSGNQKPRILLVDPVKSQAEVTRFVLENEYFKVDMALTAKEAMDLFSPGKYRGLICDMELKEAEPMYGVYLINDFRKQDPNLAVIAQSKNFPMMQVKTLKDMSVEMYTKSEESKEAGGVLDLVKKLIPIPADLKPDAGDDISRGGANNGISRAPFDGITGDLE